jgi:hypothetical protein
MSPGIHNENGGWGWLSQGKSKRNTENLKVNPWRVTHGRNVIPALRRLTQKDHEFLADLDSVRLSQK